MKPPASYRDREQTYVKHFFLEKYLERVAYNIFSFREEFVYVDGFYGPWKSSDESHEDTSFLIAIDQLRKVREGWKQRGKEVTVRCLFNDSDRKAYENLKEVVRPVQDIEIKALCRKFEDVVPEIADFVGKSFSLTFIDPTGWTGFGLQKIRPLLELPGEVIINFMYDHVARFLEHPHPELVASFDPLFGGKGWYEEVLESVKSGNTREDAILDVYQERLRQFGGFKYVTSTRILKPLADRSYFFLVYGTRHWKGLVEFRAVEKKAVEEQELVRSTKKLSRLIDKSGQQELFTSDTSQTGPRTYEGERQKNLEIGYKKVQALLDTYRSVSYESLIGAALEIPLFWESDLKAWLKNLRERGEIEIPQLQGRANTPKQGHTIHLKRERTAE